MIEWSEDGTGFVVKQPKRLEKEFLHKYFKHSNFSSFARQLGFYGLRKSTKFVKMDSSILSKRCCEYRHKSFIRGRLGIMTEIQRKTYGSTTNTTNEMKTKMESLASRVDELNNLVQKLLKDELITESTDNYPVQTEVGFEDLNPEEIFQLIEPILDRM